MKDILKVIRRELGIIRKRPVYILASVGVLLVNAIFYISLMRDGLPHDLPIGLVDLDQSSTSRALAQQLDATQLGKVIYYDDFHRARQDMETGRLTSYLVIPEGFNADIQAQRQPHIAYYVNSLYFVGGALAYKDILTMVNLTSGAVQRQVLRMKGVNEREIMNRIQPIVLDQHQIGNPATNYGVYLNGVLLSHYLGWDFIDAQDVVKFDRTVLGITLELLLFHWLKYPLKGSLWWMFLDILLLVTASEALAVFIVELFPVLRIAISIGAIVSVLGISLAGFTFPVEGMPPYIQGFSAIFPLRHYYLFHVQETIWGSGFAGWWQEVVHLLLFLFLPPVFFRRLKSAYFLQDYERN